MQESGFIFLQTVLRHKPEKLEATAMVVYAFDVDDTLEVSKGPVKLADLAKLREDGHIVGLCGNWAMVTLHCPGWHHICSFVGPCGSEKHDFLRQLRQHIPGTTT